MVAPVETTPLSTEVESLRTEITGLKSLVQSLTFQQPPKQRRPGRQRSANPAPRQQQHSYCWYHHKFGEAARKCQSPCSWPGNSQAGH